MKRVVLLGVLLLAACTAEPEDPVTLALADTSTTGSTITTAPGAASTTSTASCATWNRCR